MIQGEKETQSKKAQKDKIKKKKTEKSKMKEKRTFCGVVMTPLLIYLSHPNSSLPHASFPPHTLRTDSWVGGGRDGGEGRKRKAVGGGGGEIIGDGVMSQLSPLKLLLAASPTLALSFSASVSATGDDGGVRTASDISTHTPACVFFFSSLFSPSSSSPSSSSLNFSFKFEKKNTEMKKNITDMPYTSLLF
jgi:hypothetical protein